MVRWRLARRTDFADGWWSPGRSEWPRRSRWRYGADDTARCPARVNCRPSRGRPAVRGPGWRRRRRRAPRRIPSCRSRNLGRSTPALDCTWSNEISALLKLHWIPKRISEKNRVDTGIHLELQLVLLRWRVLNAQGTQSKQPKAERKTRSNEKSGKSGRIIH